MMIQIINLRRTLDLPAGASVSMKRNPREAVFLQTQMSAESPYPHHRWHVRQRAGACASHHNGDGSGRSTS
ncbi:MAG: hypothetical protein RLZZ245_2122 [Verrucomicrobiota bacterium]